MPPQLTSGFTLPTSAPDNREGVTCCGPGPRRAGRADVSPLTKSAHQIQHLWRK